MNLGYQQVRSWDRNYIVRQLRDGVAMRVNSHVYVGFDPKNPDSVKNKDVYLAPHSKNVVSVSTQNVSNVGKQAQELIDNAPQGEFLMDLL